MSYYKHGGDIYTFNKIIDFSSNINPLEMPENIKNAIIENIDLYGNFPDPLYRELREKIAEFENVNFNKVVCGNGLSEMIYKTIIAINPKKTLIMEPCFSEYAEALKIIKSKIERYTLKDENDFYFTEEIFELDFSGFDLVIISNPNNPTGIAYEKEFILNILEYLDPETFLIIDEGYNNFLESSIDYTANSHLDEYPNVIILRSFSHMYKMAGLRLGYALFGDFSIALKAARMLQPWNISVVAAKCGIAALDEVEFVKNSVKTISEYREFMKQELSSIVEKVYDSRANYIFFKHNSSNLSKQLKDHNILIRNCENFIGLNKNYYRIAIKNMEENLYFLDILKKITYNFCS